MPTPARLRPLHPQAILFLAYLAITAVHGSLINGSKSRKLDDETVVSKCGGCPCNNPCTTPYYPPPPPPPTPPPPAKRPPSTGYCPPPPYIPRSPPYPEFIYNGPPESLYPINPNYGDAGGRSSLVALAGFGAGLAALIMMGL
ncbi:hypothetical protein V2J09_020595 [Rumex salicifolius]